uniref:Helitron_like_N domain-containing protein n=1 Tax=Steinernema glaseri TaxID=37863 RepID=A0A1I7XY80_9BILA
MCNQVERHEMDYKRGVQDGNGNPDEETRKDLRQTLAKDLITALEKKLEPGQVLGKVYMSPKDWKGSRAYMQTKYADFKAIVSQKGKVTWFLTFTGNPAWPEIQRSLCNTRRKGTYIHNPNVMNRVFMAKVFMAKYNELLKDIHERNVLGKEDDPRTPEGVDQYIKAEIPEEPSEDDHSESAKQQRRLRQYVLEKMVHTCDSRCLTATGDTKKKARQTCQKHFPKPFSPFTVLGDHGPPLYMRRQPAPEGVAITDDNRHLYGSRHVKKLRSGEVIVQDNRHVVPYNPYILLKYNAHANLEYVGSAKCLEYIFKYVMKGHDRAYVKVTAKCLEYIFKYVMKGHDRAYVKVTDYRGVPVTDNQGRQVVNYDEIEHSFSVRYMAAPEALYRINGYPIVKLSHTVEKLYVHTPGGTTVVYDEKEIMDAAQAQATEGEKKTPLTQFFALCAEDEEARKLRFPEVPLHYRFDASKDKKKWIKRKYNKDIVVRVG